MGKINLRLYDIDGCLYHEYSRGGQNPDVGNWLINSNLSFLEHEVLQIQSENYSKVIVGSGTARQSSYYDTINMYRGGSCAPAFPIMQSYLESQLDCEVRLEQFFMSDIYSDKPAGESYKAILREIYQNSQNEDHSWWMFDHSKVSLIYAHVHRVATLHPHDEIVIDFYDDTDRILKDVYNFFSKSPDLLPKNVSLRIHRYSGKSIENVGDEIKGTGKIDINYDWTVRYLSSMTYSYTGVLGSSDRYIDRAEQLGDYHLKDHYHEYDRKCEMAFPDDFDYKKFKHFREHEIPKLTSDPKIIQTSSYTRAAILNQAGLIPKECVVRSKKKKITRPAISTTQKENNVPDFDISEETHQKIMDEMMNYISSRTSYKNGKIQLSWFTRFFRDADLTGKKLESSAEFLRDADDTRSYLLINNMVKYFIKQNQELEKNKTYSPFTKSGFAKSLNHIQKILNEEVRKPRNRISQ